MRIAVVVFATFATILSLTVNSIYLLFVLCADFVYVILFPQFLCVIHVPVSNSYGALVGFVGGYILRFAAGEPALNIPAAIKYPLFEIIDGVPTQLFPFRTLTMVVSLVLIIFVSILTDYIFRRGYLDRKWDVLRCVVNLDQSEDDETKMQEVEDTKKDEESDDHAKTGESRN